MGIKTSLFTIFSWLKSRAYKTAYFDTSLTLTIFSIWLVSTAAVISGGLGTPTGFGTHIDLTVYVVLHTILFLTAMSAGGYVLSLLYIPVPRFFTACFAYSTYITYFILSEANLGPEFSWIVTGIFMLSGICLGIILTAVSHKRLSWKGKLGWSVLPAAFILFIFLWSPTIENDHVTSSFDGPDYITPLAVADPSVTGPYSFTSFSYGDGQDNHREEYRHHAQLQSETVDASHYIDSSEWENFRQFFWGFDETELALNGRVWMPDGEGTFPLVLIVHGNHRMENFSDPGYAYLGEMLASQGYIAVSVDQNFLNYSNWTGIPNEDMKLRSWILMQHLLQIGDFHETPDTPFYNKVDLQRVSLIGHSRGGQAVAMLADYERWFEDDDTIAGFEDINVEAVAAIAPTDSQVDDMRPEPSHVSYLTLHGARDGDVHNYHGDRQYSRVSIPGDSDHFKAGVYIAEANHSQFNTEWGRMDMRLPGGMFLNRNQMMSPEEQRQVTKVYISAFLESAVQGNDQYMPLFRDVRYGEEWLPDTQYVTRFENRQFMPLVNYNRADSKTELTEEVAAEGTGFDKWEIESAENRVGNRKRSQGMAFEWQDQARYVLQFSESFFPEELDGDYESLVLSMANMNLDNESADFTNIPEVTVELETSGGTEVAVALEQFKPVMPSIATQFTINPFFEDIMRDGKYSEAVEPVFQHYEIPVQSFKEQSEDFELSDVTELTVRFSNGPGKLMIDDIGFMSQD